jgi:phosphomannomutase
MDIAGLAFEDEPGYRRFADLAAHEFFHAWNVKRIHDAALGRLDYTRENYTRLLWLFEGFTDYLAHLIMLRAGVISGLLACGHDVIDLGVVSTPVIQHAVSRRGAAGGVSIGASHNSAEWNALKFLGPAGSYLSTADAGELLDLYHLRRFSYATWEKIGTLEAKHYGNHQYLEDLAAAFDFPALAKFKVVIDCANGTSSKILRSMIERHGFNFVLINERPGAFAHEPTTSAAIVALQLAPLVKPTHADAGFLFDVDSDRVAMATEEGVAVSEEMMLPLLADYLLPRSPAKLVITNLSTTALVDEIAARHGGTVVRVPVGRQAATDALANYSPEQIAVAGEGTGAVMMPRFRFVYDGIAAMLAVLTMMHERKAKLSEILATYPRYCILKGQIPLHPRQIPALFAGLESRYSDGAVNSIDGLRVDWPERWFHVRVSQTEPIVRVICEQRGDPPHALFEELMDEVRRFAT